MTALPHSPTAERGVIGCVLLDIPAGVRAVRERAGHGSPLFYDPACLTVWQAAAKLTSSANGHSDLAHLEAAMRASGALDRIGGFPTLAGMMDGVPSPAALGSYIEEAIGYARRRQVIQAAQRAIREAQAGDLQADEVIAALGLDVRALEVRTEAAPGHTVEAMLSYDVSGDPNKLIGARWLCRGMGAWLIGPSGIGKSSLLYQFGAHMATGRPLWGITPTRPLRVLLVQAENDVGDMAEMTQGVLGAMGCADEFSPDFSTLRENLILRTCTGRIGAQWCAWLRQEILATRAELVLVDPLLSFAGIEVGRQDQCSRFLREWLDPVLRDTGAAMLAAHHTGKPPGKDKEPRQVTMYDLAYAGLGSSELVNWARAICLLQPAGDGVFRLLLTKRGRRAGACHPDGTETTCLWLRHAQGGAIYWEQAEPPAEPEEAPTGPPARSGRPSKVDALLAVGLGPVVDALPPEGVSLRELARRIEAHAAKQSHDAGQTTCRLVVARLVENHAVAKGPDGLYYTPGKEPKS